MRAELADWKHQSGIPVGVLCFFSLKKVLRETIDADYCGECSQEVILYPNIKK